MPAICSHVMSESSRHTPHTEYLYYLYIHTPGGHISTMPLTSDVPPTLAEGEAMKCYTCYLVGYYSTIVLLLPRTLRRLSLQAVESLNPARP